MPAPGIKVKQSGTIITPPAAPEAILDLLPPQILMRGEARAVIQTDAGSSSNKPATRSTGQGTGGRSHTGDVRELHNPIIQLHIKLQNCHNKQREVEKWCPVKAKLVIQMAQKLEKEWGPSTTGPQQR